MNILIKLIQKKENLGFLLNDLHYTCIKYLNIN